MLISHSLISYNLFDGLIFMSLFVIHDTIINASKIKEELAKDLNTKNYIYQKEKLEEIFRAYIVDIQDKCYLLQWQLYYYLRH